MPDQSMNATREGRDSLESFNATRRVFGLPPMDPPCGTCAGDCPTPIACQQPERPRQFRPDFTVEGPFLPRTREGWGRLVGAVLGIAGAAFFAGAAGRYWGWF